MGDLAKPYAAYSNHHLLYVCVPFLYHFLEKRCFNSHALYVSDLYEYIPHIYTTGILYIYHRYLLYQPYLFQAYVWQNLK